MRGILVKSIRDAAPITITLGVALMLSVAMFAFVLPQFQRDLGDLWVRLPFMRAMVSALLGIEVGDEFTAQMIQGVLWVHPVVLALTWTHAIVFCTRLPAGEIDRGTIDVLLSLPVSRRAVYLADTAVFLGSGLVLLAMGAIGYVVGSQSVEASYRPGAVAVGLVLANLYCLYLAVGGVTYLASAASSRRGPAVAIVLGIVIASFLLNFLVRFWDPARSFAFLGVLDYYRPAQILRDGRPPLGDMAVLLAVGTGAWLIGGEILARRSICTT